MILLEVVLVTVRIEELFQRRQLSVFIAKPGEVTEETFVQCHHEGCTSSFTQSAIPSHERTCIYRIFKCPAPKCTFKGNKENYSLHLFSAHEDEVIDGSRYAFCGEVYRSRPKDTSFATITNDVGRPARLGSTGKYYCSASLEPECFCCDGFCGPNAGCNCKSCMKLDVSIRGLPPNWYVNKYGAACRKSEDTGQFHCGRKIQMSDEDYCGPFNGPSCRACRDILTQHKTRYSGVWQFPLEETGRDEMIDSDSDDSDF